MAGYEIDEAKRRKLAEDGCIRLRGAIPDALLLRWQRLAAECQARALEAHWRGDRLPGACVVEDPMGPRLIRYDDLLAVDGDAVLDLLAFPAMLSVAKELSGRGTVPMQLDILYKQPGSVIQWHQGAPHPRGHPYLNVGIYLDDADPGDGCLRYVPGSQHALQDISRLSSEHGWEIPGCVEQPASAGDILVQDMMVLHGSPPKRTQGARRTIYVELRPVAGIRESGAQSERWLELRERWMVMVLRRADPDAWPREWHTDLPTDLASDRAEIEAIAAEWEPPIPAVYSRFPVETDDYPVPSNLR